MKNLATVAIMSVALLGSQVANAHHVPAPSGALSGIVTVKKGLELECQLDMNFNPSTGMVGISLTPGDPRCAALVLSSSSYGYSYNPGTHEVTVNGVYVTTITLGDCTGNISGEGDGAGLFIDAILPTATVPTADCTVFGYID